MLWAKQHLEPHMGGGSDTVSGKSFRQWIAGLLGIVQETETEMRLGQNYIRTFLVTGYPEGPAYLGRLNRLAEIHTQDPMASEIQVRITHYMIPSALPNSLTTRWLRKRQRGMAEETAAEGTPDAGVTKALRAYTDIHNAVSFAEDRVFELWIAVTIGASDVETLYRMQQRLNVALSALNMSATPLVREQAQGLAFSHCLGLRQTDLMRAWLGRISHTLPLSYLYPYLHGSITEGHGVYIGHEYDQLGFRHAVHIDFTRGTGAMNWVIAGASGEGKSTLIKAIDLGLIAEGFQVYQYDANNEYRELCDFLGGTHVDMTTGSGNYFEPLVIPAAIGEPSYDNGRFARTCQLFHAVIAGLVPDLTAKEKDFVDKLLMMCWKKAGVDRDRPDTWDKSASIHDWYALLEQHPSDLAEGLRSRLAIYFEGSLPLFRNAHEATWSPTVPYVRIAIDSVTNDVTDERIAATKTLLCTHRVWDAVVANKAKGLQYAMVNVDEGQRVLRNPDMAQHLYNLATDGRKYNAGLSVSANDITVFSTTQAGRGLWENASLRVLFYMADSGIRKASEDAFIPDPVLEQLRSMSGTYQFMVSRDLRRWARARVELPDIELHLARTRGLRQ